MKGGGNLTAHEKLILRMKAKGGSLRQQKINDGKKILETTFKDDPTYYKDGVSVVGRNIIYPRISNYKNSGNQTPISKIQTLLSERFYIGDLLIVNSEYWLCIDAHNYNDLYWSGIIQKCNLNLCFQNNTSDVLKQWCVITDSYSEVSSSGKIITTPIGKTNILMPYTNITQKIYKDKRFMIDTTYDNKGKQIGVVYNVSGYDSKTKDYGVDGRLIVLTVESGTFSENEDDLAKMICNYISPSTKPDPVVPNPNLLNCVISGSSILKSGGSARKYEAKFYKADGVTVDTTILPIWKIVCLPEHVSLFHMVENANIINISVDENTSILGTEIKLTLTDSKGLYNSSEFTIKVVAAFG